jgi:hypothetical protein
VVARDGEAYGYVLDIVTSTVPGVVHVTFENFAVASFSSK